MCRFPMARPPYRVSTYCMLYIHGGIESVTSYSNHGDFELANVSFMDLMASSVTARVFRYALEPVLLVYYVTASFFPSFCSCGCSVLAACSFVV